MKEDIQIDEAVIILDFAENYSLVQDTAQRYHCVNAQTTLHWFVIYYRGPNGNLCHVIQAPFTSLSISELVDRARGNIKGEKGADEKSKLTYQSYRKEL